jgi:hypothetical protein
MQWGTNNVWRGSLKAYEIRHDSRNRLAAALLCRAVAPAQYSEPRGSATAGKQPSIDQDDFDRTLRRIMWESTSLFRELEGERLENRRREYYYQPKIRVNGRAGRVWMTGTSAWLPLLSARWDRSGIRSAGSGGPVNR